MADIELNKCFNERTFDVMNNIDIEMLYRTLNYVMPKIKNERGYFFDVGCNSGSFIKALSLLKKTQNIHAFEPHPILANKVRETYPYITLFEGCVGSYNGAIDIFIPSRSCLLSSIVYRPVFNRLDQPIVKYGTNNITIDTYCDKNNIDYINFIKIDVEGAELHVFKGAEKMLRAKKILCGCYEFGETLQDAGTSEEEIERYLSSLGYKIQRIDSNNNLFYDISNFN